MRNSFWALLGVSIFSAVAGCASPTDGGDGGAGGAGTTGSAGTGGSSATGTTTGTAGTTTSTTTGTGGGGTGGGMPCGPQEHLCGGICTNLPANGCYADPTCTPCPQPENGLPICSPQGTCDIQCFAGFTKSGDQCVCASQCCSNADCATGQACNNGVCEAGPSTCDPGACFVFCFAQMMVGGCVGDMCVCTSP